MDNPVFVPPSWLNDQDAETIHKRMMEALPADIDDTEAGFPWDLTMPTALEKAEMLEFHLVETLKLMQPMWAYGEWLDYHASAAHVTRRPANAAYGIVTVTGLAGTEIPTGFIFAVPAVGNSPAVEFATEEAAKIEDAGSVKIGVTAVEAGPSGNVPAGAIAIMSTPMTGITGITNEDRTTGGTEEEDDDTLRERVNEANQAAEAGFVGCDADYIRWAKEVAGVGTPFVIANWNPDVKNSVKLVILDSNGDPANGSILEAVEKHIMSPDDRINRKAPVGAILTVCAPDMVELTYTLTATLRAGYKAADVKEYLKEELQAYYVEAKEENLLQYNRLHAIFTEAPGIHDFADFKVNGAAKNITLEQDEYPETASIDLGPETEEVLGT